MRYESGWEGGQEANGASRCLGCWCVVCASPRCPGANQGREGCSGKQVKFKVAGPCLGRRRREQGTRRAGRAACIKTRRCGGWGVENRKRRGKKKKRETKQKRDERERNACVCQARAKPRCCLDACCFTSSFTRGGECSAASKAGTKPRLGILKELQHYPSGSSHCKAAVLGTSTPSTPSTPAPGAS